MIGLRRNANDIASAVRTNKWKPFMARDTGDKSQKLLGTAAQVRDETAVAPQGNSVCKSSDGDSFMTTQNTTDNEPGEALEPPERIWLLKSVVALLGTSDFVVPPKMREHAFEYIRAPVVIMEDVVDRTKAAWAAHGVVLKHECVNSVRAGQLATEVLRTIEALPAAASSAPAERFVVHEPTGVVECNDSACPLGSTIVGWPHTFGEGCMYAATVLPAAELSGPRCPKCRYVMCEQFDSRPVNALADIVTPNGTYICYHCTPLQPEGEQVCKCGLPKTHVVHLYESQESHAFVPKDAATITRHLAGAVSPEIKATILEGERE